MHGDAPDSRKQRTKRDDAHIAGSGQSIDAFENVRGKFGSLFALGLRR